MNINKAILIIIACLSFQLFACAGMEMQYQSAKKADTIEAYEEFLKKYPHASSEIKKRHKQLKDKRAFNEAEKINTTEAYKIFEQNYPDNLYIEEARKRLAESDKDAYARTLLIGTEKALAGYIASYPASIYLSDAKERIAWIIDQDKHIADVEVDVQHLGYSESYAKKEKILKTLKNGLINSGVYLASEKSHGSNNHIMDVSIEYVGDPPPSPTVGEVIPMVTLGGAIPALVGVLVDEVLDDKLIRSRKKIENGYKMKIAHGDGISFDTGYYYIDDLDPSYFIKLHDVIIWLKESNRISGSTLYTIMGIPDSSLRDETARALSNTPNISNQQLIAALDNEDWKVRESAVKALSYREDENTIYYIKPLVEDNHYMVRISALKTLAMHDYKKSSEILISALSDEHEIVRKTAVVVQRAIKDKQALPQLINCLKDTSIDVRVEAAWAIKEIGDMRAVGALIEALNDKELLVRIRVKSALQSITGQDFGSDTEKWQKWWSSRKRNI